MSSDEDNNYLLKLLNLAQDFASTKEWPISTFFRNNNEEYFKMVEENDNVLPIRLKDKNGDQRSPINKKLKGVFLDITLREGSRPSSSPFGKERVTFPIEGLFNKSTNLYFTDFYCKIQKNTYKGRKPNRNNHFVTLVITKRGSEADNFCKKNLLQLNPKTNPFLKKISGPGQAPKFTSIANPPMHVEVFYTEEVDLNALKEKLGPDSVTRYTTGLIGDGRVLPEGLPKNISCSTCNPSFSMKSTKVDFVLSSEDGDGIEDEDSIDSGEVTECHTTSTDTNPSRDQEQDEKALTICRYQLTLDGPSTAESDKEIQNDRNHKEMQAEDMKEEIHTENIKDRKEDIQTEQLKDAMQSEQDIKTGRKEKEVLPESDEESRNERSEGFIAPLTRAKKRKLSSSNSVRNLEGKRKLIDTSENTESLAD